MNKDVVCVTFSHDTLSRGFHVVTPSSLPQSSTSPSFVVKVFAAIAQHEFGAWSAKVTAAKHKHAAIRKEDASYLQDVLKALQSGTAAMIAMSSNSVPMPRTKFAVVLDAPSSSGEAQLHVMSRNREFTYANIALTPMKVSSGMLVCASR